MDNFGLHHREFGSGPAVLLVHGFPDDGTIWMDAATALSSKFRVIVPDMPGAGQTPLKGATSIADMGMMIKALLDKLGIERVVIAGHSMGGYISLAFAKQCPERVAGLSLIHSTPLADDDEKKKNRQKAIDLIINGGREPFIKQLTNNLFATSFRTSNPELINSKAARSEAITTEALVNFYRAMMDRESSEDLVKRASAPAQWIMGSEDNVISFRSTLALCHSSPVNFVHLYHGCGHTSMLEQPETLAADLEQFAGYCYRNP